MTLYILLPTNRLKDFLQCALREHIIVEVVSFEEMASRIPKPFIPEILENEVRKLTPYYYPAEEKTWVDETKKKNCAKNIRKCTHPKHRQVYRRERRS
jgi:hypothetical protein